jgi:ABC-type spermidine/putrescine transport system permease subunit II
VDGLALRGRAPELRVAVLEAATCGWGPSGRDGSFIHGYWSYVPMLRELLGDERARDVVVATNAAAAGWGPVRGRMTVFGFTLANWQNPFGVPGLRESIVLSLEIAALASILATILGTLVALALVRYSFRGRGTTNMLIFLPMTSPEIVLGASLLAPGIMAALFLAFALSVDDFVITNVNAGAEVTFPMYVWGAARVGVPPQVNVIGTVIFLLAIVAMLGNVLLQMRRKGTT